MKKRTYNAVLTDEQHASFKYHCSVENITISEKIEKLILEWLKTKNKN